MTLTQLNAFVMVARLRSVTTAAHALGVSEPAVSQALSALRQHLGDPLITRGPEGMTLTPGGSRLLGTASRMVALGAEAHAAVRAAQGATEQLRTVTTPAIAEFVITPLMEAFGRHYPGSIETSVSIAGSSEMGVMVANRLADIAIGPRCAPEADLPVTCEPVFRYRMIVVTGRQRPLRGSPRQWRWLVGPAGTDPATDTGQMLAALGVPDDRISVLPNQTAAWAAAADGGGVAPAVEHLIAPRVRRGELALVDLPALRAECRWYATLLQQPQRSTAAGALRQFLGTPTAMQLMRSPDTGIARSRFRPPVYVTLWS
jgi:DNA-binding transcriptional LysR family regulator